MSTPKDHNQTLNDPGVSVLFGSFRSQQLNSPASACSVSAGTSMFRRAPTATDLIGSKITPTKLASPGSKRNLSMRRLDSFQNSTKVADPVMDFDMSLFEDGYSDFLHVCVRSFSLL